MGTPTIAGDTTGTVERDSGIVIGGDLDDVGFLTDNTDDTWSITTGPSYGTATIDPVTGAWTYDLDDTNSAVTDLEFGDTLTDTFLVLMVDNSGFGAGESDAQLVTITITVPCLTLGTMVDTEHGPRAIETIRVGERVRTETGLEPVRWTGRRHLSADALTANPKLQPIRIMAGALGFGVPTRDLLVSRQHRMLVQSKIASRMFGATSVLVPAVKLLGLPGIYVDTTITQVTYLHLLFDQHEIIYAESAPTESLY
ncbi:MAG: Hint domain-containing protein, partial [Pseudomonadota bacterium]